jgi:tRNA 2-thiouridine synthesizing protein C
MKKILLLFRHGPHGRAGGREGLELALAALAFDHQVDALFMGDGVLLLKHGQDTHQAHLKDYAPGFRALLQHGLERAVVIGEDLAQRGLQPSDLQLAAERMDAPAAARWIAEHEVCLSF